MAAVLGGTQSLHTNARDEALALPTEESARLALRTQQIIAYESGVTKVADPLGGSFYIEKLTDEIERGRAGVYRAHRRDGRDAGRDREGLHPGAKSRTPRTNSSKQVERGEKIVVGVNRFQQDGERPPAAFRIDPEIEQQQVERLARIAGIAGRTHAVETRLDDLEQAARGSDNLMPQILAACEACATVGEISDRLRKVFGEYREHDVGSIHIIGGGLAGCEAAWQVARAGGRAVLYEMRPRATDARAQDRRAGRVGVQQFAQERAGERRSLAA